VLGVIAVAVAFLLLYDFKGLAERRSSAALGRPVTIGSLHLGIFPLEAVLQDINVADVPLGQPVPDKKPPFMRATHVDAVVGFWRLLGGDLVFRHLNVEEAVARIERRPDGSLSWEINEQDQNRKAELPEIRDVSVRDVKVLYTDAANKTKLTLNLETRAGINGNEATLILKGDGTYMGQPSAPAIKWSLPASPSFLG